MFFSSLKNRYMNSPKTKFIFLLSKNLKFIFHLYPYSQIFDNFWDKIFSQPIDTKTYHATDKFFQSPQRLQKFAKTDKFFYRLNIKKHKLHRLNRHPCDRKTYHHCDKLHKFSGRTCDKLHKFLDPGVDPFSSDSCITNGEKIMYF